MNYLVHLYLSDPDPDCLLGNLMGDFVKGPLGGSYSSGMRQGMIQHRAVDSFAQDNTTFRRSKRRLDARFGHCRGVMIDVFYDHILASNWERFAQGSLESFAAQIYRLLEANHARLPAGLRQVAPRMISGDWLVSYREPKTIATVLSRLADRLSRPTPIAEGAGELTVHRQGLTEDCALFLKEARLHLDGLRRGPA